MSKFTIFGRWYNGTTRVHDASLVHLVNAIDKTFNRKNPIMAEKLKPLTDLLNAIESGFVKNYVFDSVDSADVRFFSHIFWCEFHLKEWESNR